MRLSLLLLLLVLLLALFQPSQAIRCMLSSYDIKNWPSCTSLDFFGYTWSNRCMGIGSGVLCSDYRISSGCPDVGVLPCQYDSLTLALRDSNSYCKEGLDYDLCDRTILNCRTTVTTHYLMGSVAYWTIDKGCGKCSFTTSVKSSCLPSQCLGTAASSCTVDCYFKSEERFDLIECKDCVGDLCNFSTRRAAHHLVTLLCSSLFLVLIFRKCRA
mmetsp:Transcript_6651/g.15270  ORF Transcript_6651/g.15270 Transcript_6651/m.15270 type:complete len:214 (+) Transcript_6651:65-706(+)